MKRIFIAIKIPLIEKFLAFTKSLNHNLADLNISWNNITHLHITLNFIGETNEDTIEKIIPLLNNISNNHKKFELNISGLGTFQPYNKNQIIWIGINADQNLLLLHQAISKALLELGMKSQKQYKPHITIGKFKPMANLNIINDRIKKYQNLEIDTFDVTEFILFESFLKETGAIHKPIKIFNLT